MDACRDLVLVFSVVGFVHDSLVEISVTDVADHAGEQTEFLRVLVGERWEMVRCTASRINADASFSSHVLIISASREIGTATSVDQRL